MKRVRFFSGFMLAFVGVGLLFTSCLSTSEEVLYPENTAACDTVPGIYSRDVQRLLVAKCTGCHSAAGQTQPYFETYNQVLPHANHLLERVTLTPGAPGFMPQGGNKLTACEIRTIEKWLNNGKPQN